MGIKVPINVELPDNWAELVAQKLIDRGDCVLVVRCRDCKWFGHSGCAIEVVDDSDRPKEDDYCSFGERKGEDE